MRFIAVDIQDVVESYNDYINLRKNITINDMLAFITFKISRIIQCVQSKRKYFEENSW